MPEICMLQNMFLLVWRFRGETNAFEMQIKFFEVSGSVSILCYLRVIAILFFYLRTPRCREHWRIWVIFNTKSKVPGFWKFAIFQTIFDIDAKLSNKVSS